MPSPSSLCLFPLHTVLLPGGTLGLRIFEPRYLDMVRECGRTGSGFGVCLILDGEEAGAAAAPVAFGTEARIEDFDTGQDGLLALQVRGVRRFAVRQTRVRDNGLLVGEVDWRPDDAVVRVQPQHALLPELLQRIADRAGLAALTGAEKARFDDAAWVGWRLAELLPLEDAQRQALLQDDDPHTRLSRLLGWIA